ncbi:MAG: hypothetical protein ABI164_00190, partial [Acidobacteriaceae bacterium]
KYSVPPVLAAFLLLRRRWRLLFFSALPGITGFLFFTAWLHTPFWILLAEPFRSAAHNVSPGLANMMAVSEIALRRPPLFQTVPDAFYLSVRNGWVDFIPEICGVVLAVLIAVYCFVRGQRSRVSGAKPSGQPSTDSGASFVDGRIYLACLTAASLLCFKHQIYDFLLLVFCLAIALQAPRSAARTWLLLLIAYFWYVERLVHIHRWEFWPAVVIVSFGMLAGLIVAAWKLREAVRWQKGWEL